MSINVGIDIEHRDVAKKLRIVLKSSLVVGLNHLLPNFIFNHLLSLNVVGVGISQLELALLLRLLPRHNLLKSFTNQLFNLIQGI